MRTLYYALVNSRLQYAIQCWGGTFKTYLTSLRTLQNHIVRIILFKNKFQTAFPLYKQLNIFPLQYLFVFKVLKLFYKISGGKRYELGNYTTRSQDQKLFRRPKVHKTFFRQSFLFLGPKFFNTLPLEIKSSVNINIFQKRIKPWLFSTDNIETLFEVLV